jgi:hypothetical protein
MYTVGFYSIDPESTYYVDDISWEQLDIVSDIFEEEEISFSTYPNPARDELFVELPAQAGDYVFSLVDITGASVFSQELSESGLTRIGLQRFASGIYMARLQGAQTGQSKVKRIVIAH